VEGSGGLEGLRGRRYKCRLLKHAWGWDFEVWVSRMGWQGMGWELGVEERFVYWQIFK
jgi:hypothetical protein